MLGRDAVSFTQCIARAACKCVRPDQAINAAGRRRDMPADLVNQSSFVGAYAMNEQDVALTVRRLFTPLQHFELRQSLHLSAQAPARM